MTEDLIDLQTKLAFQDQHLHELTDIVTAQQKQIDQLRAELKLFREQLGDIEDAHHQGAQPFSPVDEKPPHY